MFVSVAIPIPASKTFTYTVPEVLVPDVAVGKRVLVPFGKKRLTGFILDTQAQSTGDREIREILGLPDPDPLFDATDLPFYEWISRYYLYPLGQTLAEILPAAITLRSRRWIRLAVPAPPAPTSLPTLRAAIVATLAHQPEGLPFDQLRQLHPQSGLAGHLRALEASGLIQTEERLPRTSLRARPERWVNLRPDPPAEGRLSRRQAALLDALRRDGPTRVADLPPLFSHPGAALRSLARRGYVELMSRPSRPVTAVEPEAGSPVRPPLQLNGRQAAALEAIEGCLTSRRFAPCLLQGVTGSGKTEIYLRAIEKVLREGGGAIYLVPEIALTTQLLTRITSRFPQRSVALLHSGVAASIRYEQWKAIRKGDLPLVVGARSALFAPLPDLRLIVVDEEHDPSYKQDERLRYSARDLALVRGQLRGATVILGSATPAVQSRFHAAEGRYRHLTLPARIDDRPLPLVEIVDLRTVRDAEGRIPVLSPPLVAALRETLERKKQSLLFLNRRGFHTFLFCPDCGRAASCPNCDLSLTFHAATEQLKCHHCDYVRRPDARCPACGGERIRSYGTGTERVEEEAQRLFPEARIARLDSDTTARRGSLEALLRQVERREVDILVGTQMITKGHDFPDITLVGVVAADAALNLADFRAAERTFQVLTQVAGRSGRGDMPGRVIIQSFNPGHYALQRVREHDYEGFYAEELGLRRELEYPPFSRIVGLHFSHRERDAGKEAVTLLGRKTREAARGLAAERIEVIGPAESPLARIRGRYRWQMLLKGPRSAPLQRLAAWVMAAASGGLQVQLDVDPLNFM